MHISQLTKYESKRFRTEKCPFCGENMRDDLSKDFHFVIIKMGRYRIYKFMHTECLLGKGVVKNGEE